MITRIFLCFFLICQFFTSRLEAAEFHILGRWQYGVNAGNVYGQNYSDVKDHVQAVQRIRTQFGFKASPSLDGQVQIEIGKIEWGNGDQGGALGADGRDIKLRYAFLDWGLPVGGAKVRMGLQPFNMPAFVNGSPIFSEDGAGIVVSDPLSENIDVTAMWIRAAADNSREGYDMEAFNTSDLWGLVLANRGDGWRWSPYAMLGNIGINSFGYRTEKNHKWTLHPYKSSLRTLASNLTPVGGLDVLADRKTSNKLNFWTNPWWLGIGGETDFSSPWRLSGEFAYGSSDFGSARIHDHDFDMKRSGWYAAFLAEYKFDWGLPGLLGWYSSGDDDNPWNGSERMPVGKSANRDWKVLNIAYDGAPFCPAGGAQIISPNGTMIGTWGVVGRARDLSFIKDLKHTLKAGYVRGTNSPDMVTDNPMWTDKKPGGYLTHKDEAYEVDFETHYKIYENLTLILDLDWLRINWDKSVWDRVDNNLIKDFYRVGFTAFYHF